MKRRKKRASKKLVLSTRSAKSIKLLAVALGMTSRVDKAPNLRQCETRAWEILELLSTIA